MQMSLSAYFKATLKFMGPLPRQRSALYEYNYLVSYDIADNNWK